jgi:hypothetical protein
MENDAAAILSCEGMIRSRRRIPHGLGFETGPVTGVSMFLVGRDYELRDVGDNKFAMLFPAGTPRSVVEKERDITILMRQYGMDTPFVHDIEEIDGRLGLVLDTVVGPTFTKWTIDNPTWYHRLALFFAYTQHEIYLHKVPELPSVKERLNELISQREDLTESEREGLRKRLARMPGGDWTCHMAYMPYNILVSIDGPIIFRWGGAVRGDYLADVAMTSLLFESWIPSAEEGEEVEKFRERFHTDYVAEMVKITGRMDEELDAWRDILRDIMGGPGKRSPELTALSSGPL